jgi:hypothetical protein
MISSLVANWRLVSVVSVALVLSVLSIAVMLPSYKWSGSFYPGFFISGSIIIFLLTYGWPFLIRAMDRFMGGLGFKKNSDAGIKFFGWVSLVCLPLIVIDSLYSEPSPDLLFRISACLGLIGGCCHALARTKTTANKPEMAMPRKPSV